MEDTTKLKLKLVEQSINNRHTTTGHRIGLPDIVVVVIGLLAAYGMGHHTGYNTAYADYSYRNNLTTTIAVDGYDIHFQRPRHPEMQGATIGYTYDGIDNEIYIQSGLNAESTYETCVHEHLHTLGIPEEKHNWIYRFEDELVDPVCLKLLYQLDGTTRVVQ